MAEKMIKTNIENWKHDFSQRESYKELWEITKGVGEEFIISSRNKERLKELKFVSRLLADKSLLDDFVFMYETVLSGEKPEDYFISDCWESNTLYHLMLFLICLRQEKEPEGFWKLIQEVGKQLIEEEQMKIKPSKQTTQQSKPQNCLPET